MPQQDLIEGGDLAFKILADMDRITWERHGMLAFGNAERNQSVLGQGQSIAALRDEPVGAGDGAIVIAAGPSLKRFDPIRAIKDRAYKGALIVTESALAYCLRNGVVPDLVVSLDPHAERIVRWFGDPDFSDTDIAEDDYYRRQDMDVAFANERKANTEMLELLDRHGPKIRIALSTSASERVVKRVIQAGLRIYWWNPMLDDPDQPDSATRKLYRMNGLPCVNAGGNVGSACWMMADAVLGKKHVALTGMDFAYYDGTPLTSAQYYYEALALAGAEHIQRLFPRIYNPHTKSWFFADPAYIWYRRCFLDMVQRADCRTYNCTGGGILFGDGITHMALGDFLDRHGG